jgi:hypothetical protein
MEGQCRISIGRKYCPCGTIIKTSITERIDPDSTKIIAEQQREARAGCSAPAAHRPHRAKAL